MFSSPINGALGATLKLLLARACPKEIDPHATTVFLAGRLQTFVEQLHALEDPQERLALIVDRARRAPPLAAKERTDVNRVRGCVSVVWLLPEYRDGRCYFRADAESPIVRGLVVFLADFYSGITAAELAAATLDPLEELGLAKTLSPTRRNGLAAALAAMRRFAASHTGARHPGPQSP